MTPPLVRVRGLATGYGAVQALADVSFDVAAGERSAVLGPNGGGKSTLFRVLLGQLRPWRGAVELGGSCAVVPQSERSRLDYPVSALDVALMGTLSRLPWWRPAGRRERAGARSALDRVGLLELADAPFGELSGGQRQRVLVARALVQEAPILLLDEPFTGVDQPSAELLDRLIGELAADGRAVLIATHDLEQARRWDRVLCLNRRQVAFGRPAEALTRAVLEQTYGGEIVVLAHGGHDDTAVLPAHHH
jgi:ABC-type Mn2+/Zn2+ transport system ATPase subunit